MVTVTIIIQPGLIRFARNIAYRELGFLKIKNGSTRLLLSSALRDPGALLRAEKKRSHVRSRHNSCQRPLTNEEEMSFEAFDLKSCKKPLSGKKLRLDGGSDESLSSLRLRERILP